MAKEKEKEIENKAALVTEAEAKPETDEASVESAKTEEEKATESPKADAVSDEAAPTKKTARNVKSKGRGKKRKNIRQVSTGRAYVHASYNNTIVTLTDQNGNVLAWSSAGVVGFKGPKKSTPYAAGVIVRDAVEKVRPTGLREVNAFVSGIGSGREAAVRAMHANGINVMTIKDVTPIPHNGCRPPKPRRI
jgi:small subunit ribosomal protein S11